MVEEEMEEAMVEKVVVEGEMEEVVMPLGSFLSSKTAADTAARLAPQLGNSVSCTWAGREGPSWLLLALLGESMSRYGESGNRLDGSRQRFPLS